MVCHLPHIKGLKLADPQLDQPGFINLLIGCDLLPIIILSKPHLGSSTEPVALQTVYGWAIMGPYSPQATLPSSTSATVCQTLSLPNTDEVLGN